MLVPTTLSRKFYGFTLESFTSERIIRVGRKEETVHRIREKITILFFADPYAWYCAVTYNIPNYGLSIEHCWAKNNPNRMVRML